MMQSIKDIEPIEGSQAIGYGGTTGIIVKDRSDIEKIVEGPCLEACLDLYDKNIRTIDSGANKNDIGRNGFIGINYDSLDDENKKVVAKLVQKGLIPPFTLSDNPKQRGGRDFNIIVQVFDTDDVIDISNKFLQVTNFFQTQDVLYGQISYEQGLKIVDYYAGEKIDMSESDRFQFAIDIGYVYDENLKCFWENAELARKHNIYVNNTSQPKPVR
jgi:hypothetical protein